MPRLSHVTERGRETFATLEERLRRAFEYMADHVAAYRALLVHADSSSERIMQSFLAVYIARALKEGPLHISADDATTVSADSATARPCSITTGSSLAKTWKFSLIRHNATTSVRYHIPAS